MLLRRDFLKHGLAGITAAAIGPEARAVRQRPKAAWDPGSVTHLLPTVNDRRILLKASFAAPLSKPPRLVVAGQSFPGQKMDSGGRFWTFDASGLEPSRQYELALVNASGKSLCDPWPLATFPASTDQPRRLRLLMYMCAGGHDALTSVQGNRFLPVAIRARLLDRALSFQPDALIANGDHVYWDLRAARGKRLMGESAEAVAYAGRFNRTLPVLGTSNERVLERAAGPQIVPLYGNRCRSIPVFFLQDDHDYFDNDEADDTMVTFPPDDFMLRLARATRTWYYPEFLPDDQRPAGLPGASAADRAPGVSECFGTLRYGRLAELLLYDCRRTITLAGPSAVFLATEVEDWLKTRMAAPGVAHVVNVPSMPPGWSAGKWGDWYADLLEPSGRLGVSRPKPYWQAGWRKQHDRLLRAASAMKERIPLFISGDLHSIAEGRIFRTGDFDLRSNPLVAILPGPLGTGEASWPSAARGVKALPPVGLEIEEALPPLEENGFILADFTPEKIAIRFFRWKASQPLEALDTLQPFRVTELQRPG